jgi:hypothetical protein
MTLLFFIFIAVAIGYFFARGRYGQSISDTAGKAASSSRSWSKHAEDWWQSRVMKRSLSDPFRAWAAGAGADLLPEDFKSWLAGLSDPEARDFTQALDSYSSDLGYSLKDLVNGEYANKPAMMSVFVEAIVVYSQEFRKAREVDEVVPEEAEENDKTAAKKAKPAARQSSRRRKKPPAETSEAAA